MKHETKKEIDNLWLSLFWLVIVIWLIFWIVTVCLIDKWDERWTFWDMFWAINSLFSWLALAWIVYTIFLQRKELEYQRKDLELNRKQLIRSATAQENSEKELKRQADNLKETAKLNALSTLLNYHLDNISRHPNQAWGPDEKKIQEYKSWIEDILKKKTP